MTRHKNTHLVQLLGRARLGLLQLLLLLDDGRHHVLVVRRVRVRARRGGGRLHSGGLAVRGGLLACIGLGLFGEWGK